MDQTQDTTPKYWMSLDQWRQDPEFRALAEKEFMSSPLQSEDGTEQGGWARREFLKLMGASLAMTSFGCVRRPAQRIIPYVNKPPEVTHGLPNFYASSYSEGLEGLGIVVTTRDGRPIKIEGNPDHPANRGGMSARAHASILKLYDPDRYTGPKHNLQNAQRTNRETVNIKWEDLDSAVIEQLKKGKVAVLRGTCMSPSTCALLGDFAAAYGAKVYEYDDISYANLIEAQKQSYGSAGLPLYHLDKARYVLAVNNDFMGTWLAPTTQQMQFAKARKADANMNKLVVFESLMTLTGSNADERIRIRPSQSVDVIMAILHELIVVKKLSRYASDSGVLNILSGFAKTAGEIDVKGVAEELWKNRGQSLVLAGGLSADTENAVNLQTAANFLNAVLENDGKTVEPLGGHMMSMKGEGIGELLSALGGKQVQTLIIHGCNPVYSLPASAKFEALLASVPTVIYTGDRNDETARHADYVATDHHPLENWGDMIALDGTRSIQQPTIRPLYETRAFQDSLLVWTKGSGKPSAKAKAAESWYDYLRNQWKEVGVKTEAEWVNLLQKGVSEKAAHTAGNASFHTSALNGVKPAGAGRGLELALYQTIGLGDGALANVSWLQELPDPVTKCTWDNYACLSPRDASELKVKQGANVTLTVGDQKVTVPAHIQPGQADGVVGLAVGYGRKGGGQVCDGVGVNAFMLAQWKDGRRITAGQPAQVDLAGGHTDLAITQGHHTMEGRQLVVEETLKDFVKNPGGSVERTKITSMWSEHAYPGHKWGMTIDLNTCTGCSACVIACQSENNIPTVGKRYVLQGREMQWLRIDRYYVGSPENPDTVHQPLPCMHCDNAPCETVCPVIATVHGEEGTNDMIYNRCVGTRYCSNNCPYKVRRFNWFNYTNDIPDSQKLALNPDVTVRFRGVMEKCTFCIHRIKAHRSQAKLQDRPLGPNEVQTACQQSCPTGAITFGDLNNKASDVAAKFTAPASYALLEELNTKPAVRYHVKVRNVDHLKADGHQGEPKKQHGENKEQGHHA